ncbi:hypothetical protein EON81_16785 [bacterium]|nr:MAG: hypothetical protein EON81_16785 [bacterium]
MATSRVLTGIAFTALLTSAFAQTPTTPMDPSMDPSMSASPPMSDSMAPTSIAVQFNGTPVAFPEGGPMLMGERIYVPAGPIAQWMGAEIETGSAGATLVKGARTYALGNPNQVFLRDLVTAFGGTIQYDPRVRTAYVTLRDEMRQNPGGASLYAPDAAGTSMYAPDAAGTTPTMGQSSRPQTFVNPTDGTATSSWTDYLSWIILAIAVLGIAYYLLSRKPAHVIASNDSDRNS